MSADGPAPTSSWNRSARAVAWSTTVYLALTLALGVDVVRAIDTHIANDPGDPLLTAAILSWNAAHVPLTEAWWQFPIFHPTPDVLAFSEHLLGISVIATPLSWITGNPVTTYNVTLLLSYPLCALAMYALVFRLTGSNAAAFLAGLAYGFAPIRTWELPHIQNLAVFYSPIVLLGLHAFLETGRRGWLVVFGVSWLLQGSASGYMLIYGSVLLAGWLIWFVVAPGRWRDLGAIGAALVIGSLPLIPILARYSVVHERHRFGRGVAEAALFSADLASLLCASGSSTFWAWLRIGCHTGFGIFPGLTLVALCLAGAVWQWRSAPPVPAPAPPRLPAGLAGLRRALWAGSAVFAAIAAVTALIGPWRVEGLWLRGSASSPVKPSSAALGLLLAGALLLPWLWRSAQHASLRVFYLLAALATWVLSWGTAPSFLGTQVLYEAPFAWMMRLPGGDAVRVPARFWQLSVLCLVVLMGILVAEMLRRRRGPAVCAIVAISSCGLAIDGWTRIPAVATPPQPPRPDLLRGGVVLELPLGDTIGDIAAVYRATIGGWRTINGYSGYEAAGYEALRHGSLTGMGLFESLRSPGTLHVLVKDDALSLQRLVEAQPGSERVGASAGLVQYRLQTPPPVASGLVPAPADGHR